MSNSEIGTYMIPTHGDENLMRRIRDLRGEGHSLKETADILGVRLQKVTSLKTKGAHKFHDGTRVGVQMYGNMKEPYVTIDSGRTHIRAKIRLEDIDWICRELQAAKKGYEEFEKVSDEIMEED